LKAEAQVADAREVHFEKLKTGPVIQDFCPFCEHLEKAADSRSSNVNDLGEFTRVEPGAPALEKALCFEADLD
jgi:hypothetical protein